MTVGTRQLTSRLKRDFPLMLAAMLILVPSAMAQNQPPIIDDLNAAVDPAAAGFTVDFTCAAHDPDGEVTAYALDPGDDTGILTSATGEFSHVYTAEGTFSAFCVVTDDSGADALAGPLDITVRLTPPPGSVGNQPPEIESLSIERTADVTRFEVALTCLARDPDGEVVGYTADFGDGSDPAANGAGVFTHVYYNGTYTAACTARDDDGATDTAERVIEVEGYPPPAQRRGGDGDTNTCFIRATIPAGGDR